MMNATSQFKVAYYGTDRFGQPTVMVTKEWRSVNRPGWSQSETERFYSVDTIEAAAKLAASLKARGEVNLICNL